MSEYLNVTALRDAMNPPRPPKLSGAELAAQLAGTSFVQAPPAAPVPPAPEPEPAPKPEPEQRKTPAPKAAKPKGGRPAKAGAAGDALPVNVRLGLDDHAELAKLAAELLTPGRPMPTVQDVVRGVMRGALQDRETLKKLFRKGNA
jgi:hypothetical protein